MSTIEFDLDSAIRHAAKDTHNRFRRFADYDDIYNEVWVYAHGDGKRKIDKWIAADERFRIIRALCGAARQYSEQEKAHKTGYHVDDVAWYSPEKLADLVPLALDPTWDAISGAGDETAGYGSTDGAEGGTLLAMVIDVRRALKSTRLSEYENYDPLDEDGMRNLDRLADYLGGEYPDAPGYGRGRRVITNAHAQVITQNGYSE